MENQNIRLILWGTLFLIGMLIFNYWQLENNNDSKNDNKLKETKYNVIEKDILQKEKKNNIYLNKKKYKNKNLINVETNTLNIKIDTHGGDIVFLSLKKYPETIQNPKKEFILLNKTNLKNSIAQIGLFSTIGSDSKKNGRVKYKSQKINYLLNDDKKSISVKLFHKTKSNINIVKEFILKQNSYLININYIIQNKGSSIFSGRLYTRLKQTIEKKESSFWNPMRHYNGGAVNTPNKQYKKISFDEIKKTNFNQIIVGGWSAIIENYFITAWIPEKFKKHVFFTEKLQNSYSISIIDEEPTIVQPKSEKIIKTKFLAGPKELDILKSTSIGLEYTIDYGILWPIAKPIFWTLKNINKMIENWGWSIILTTVMIKLIFYKLSSFSYRSMKNMKKLQPKIEILKKQHSENKQKLGQSIMELYKKEKINPLGGCLPILIQIPVFISLYYVLIESIELRQAPFIFWIQDLSSKDPYLILPIIMGLSMLIQQKLTPAPPDPIQAKIMFIMPILFTFLSLQFPSGLILYWIVNNVLSIIQQWLIINKNL